MSERLLVAEAIRRRRIFTNLRLCLRRLVAEVKNLDPKAEIFLFGSVAEGKNLLSSDIDVLVVTKLPPEKVLAELWRRGFEDPFEIHVVKPGFLSLYQKRSYLVRLS